MVAIQRVVRLTESWKVDLPSLLMAEFSEEMNMILMPANLFQLVTASQADFALGANGSKLSSNEKMLWHNIEVYARVIEAAGLQKELLAAHEKALSEYASTENERFARYSRAGADSE
jgi:hypothetical protein